MLGAIAGDLIGSVYEWRNIKSKVFPLFDQGCTFTDDSVLAVALADTILAGADYGSMMKRYNRAYPAAGYGGNFHSWASSSDTASYNSWGSGAAMRVSPVGYAFDSLERVLAEAGLFTAVTHSHPEGIKGGQSTASAIFLARTGSSRADIRSFVERPFGYDLPATVDEIRPHHRFDESSQGTVPQAFYGGVPGHIEEPVMQLQGDPLRDVVTRFRQAYTVRGATGTS